VPRFLAGEFIGADDFDSAQALALEALQLVLDDEKLEAEVKGYLNYVAAEKQKSAPQHGRENSQPVEVGRTSVNINPTITPRAGSFGVPPFNVLGNVQIRHCLKALVVGLAALVIILSFSKTNKPHSASALISPSESPAGLAATQEAFTRLTL
jgi:hypothetical protein